MRLDTLASDAKASATTYSPGRGMVKPGTSGAQWNTVAHRAVPCVTSSRHARAAAACVCYAAAGCNHRSRMPLRPGQEIEVEIESVGMEGPGVGRVDDLVVFVARGLPGERVRARVERAKPNFARARAFEVLRPSPLRVAAPCTHLEVCGGCTWQDLDYEAQLDAKTDIVRESLRRLGGVADIDVPRALASPHTFHYRNKMEFSFFAGRDGAVVLGLHTPGTFDRVFDLEACHLMSEESNRIVARVRDWAARSGQPAYHMRRHSGFWRYLVVREGKNTGQTMVHLVTHAGTLPDAAAMSAALAAEFGSIRSLLRSVNTRRATIAVGESEEVLRGDAEIEERLGDLRFRIGANTFFQTNTLQAERLFALAAAWADLGPGDEVLDLYAGTGAISLWLARRARRVIGIELVPESVAMAVKNAALNGIDNCHFAAGDVRDFLRRRPGEAAAARVAVVDPPRAGLHPEIATALCALRPARLVYVSCNPATLARDVQLLSGAYALRRVQPVDMFPHTYHVECVALLERR
jgi:23S rRNA (uracil1939-C5)-methyltransferase